MGWELALALGDGAGVCGAAVTLGEGLGTYATGGGVAVGGSVDAGAEDAAAICWTG